MITREELIEKIAIALCEKDFGKGSCNIIKNKGGDQDCVKVECYPTAYAKIALDALLSSLPEEEAEYEPTFSNGNELYNKLLGMKK